ncbi:MAG: N-acetylglucosamine-6-phosphate deacetylase [Pyrinomonadaceae bacterium]
MAITSFSNSRAVLLDGIVDITAISIIDGMIEEIPDNAVAEATANFEGLTVFPGFIDVHIHGAMGEDVNSADADGLLTVAAFLAENGVTAWMPTLVPDSDANYRRAINAIDELMRRQVGMPVAQAVGVHYEGVFASRVMCGALRPEYFKTFTGPEINELPRLENGIHMMTLAPEVAGGIELIEELVKHEWIVSIGHTAADTETLDRAFDAGARHMTHFFNAMTGIHHRDIGVAGWGLANRDVTFDIIADGIHVHPKMLDLAFRSKTPEKVLLISDSVAPTGLGDGQYELWGEKVSVKSGRTQNERGSIAGSVSTMFDGVRMFRSLGFSDIDIEKMASSNPARLLGLDKERGSIEIGKRADIVGLDADANVSFTMIGGRMAEK